MNGHPAVGDQFTPIGTYLDTASYGLPPRRAIAALESAIGAWARGTAYWPDDWDRIAEDCRALLASLTGVQTGDVALMPAVSVAVGTVMSIMEPGDEVLVPDDEFSSVLLPLLAAAGERSFRIRRVPFARLPDEIDGSTRLVATSHVRSNGGGRMDLDALAASAHAHGALTLVDATHSVGVLPIDARRRGLHFVTAAAYKHLLCPRGVAFLAVAPEWQERLVPRCASWRGQVDPYRDYFGGDLGKLAAGAARLDVSLAWFSWVGAYESLSLLDSVAADERVNWCVGLADAFSAALALPATGSSVIGVPVLWERDRVRAALERAAVTMTCGEGTVRVSFHLYNGEDDLDRGLRVLAPMVDRGALD